MASISDTMMTPRPSCDDLCSPRGASSEAKDACCSSKASLEQILQLPRGASEGARAHKDVPDPRLVHVGFAKWEAKTYFSGYPIGGGKVRDVSGGRDLWDFGMCSYLGLVRHPKILAAMREAVEQYGSYTSSSRAYLETPLLRDVEAKVGRTMGGHFLLTPKTHIGTMVWATTVVQLRDVLVVDNEAHVSIQFQTDLARGRGNRKVVTRHSDLPGTLAAIRAECEALDAAHDEGAAVWYCIDGVYSMDGSLLPRSFMEDVKAVSPRVRIYVDDAHGTACAGKNGCGYWLAENGPIDDRTVVALSMNKAVSSGGGGLLFKSEAVRNFARVGGLPNHWTAPLTPSELGAMGACMDILASEEGEQLRAKLAANIERFNERLPQDIPVSNRGPFPVKVIHVGTLDEALRLVTAIRNDGFFVCHCSYPVVARGHAGIRITLNAGLSLEAVDGLCESLRRHCHNLPPFSTRVRDPAFD